MITGNVYIQSANCWMPYEYEDGKLSVYSRDFLFVDEKFPKYISIPCPKFTTDRKYVAGNITKSGETIVFFMHRLPFQDDPLVSTGRIPIGNISTCVVELCLVLQDDEPMFSSMSFSCKELSHFYPTDFALKDNCFQSVMAEHKLEFISREENAKHFSFDFNSMQVNATLFVNFGAGWPAGETPVKMCSILKLEFKKTRDIDILVQLYQIVKKFLAFVYYRTNVYLGKVVLLTEREDTFDPILHDLPPESEKKYIKCINTLSFNNERIQEAEESDDYNRLNHNLYRLLETKISDLFKFISENKLYTAHIPCSSKERSRYTIGRLLLITAAFEWNANEYMDIKPDSKKSEVIEDCLSALESLSKGKKYNSKQCKHLSFIRKGIKHLSINLSTKLRHSLKQFENVISKFTSWLYSPVIGEWVDCENNMKSLVFLEFKTIIDELPPRIEKQRNNFAHGNMREEVYNWISLDYLTTEWLNYCIVLREIGYSENEIFNIINAIFSRGFPMMTSDENINSKQVGFYKVRNQT
ncbi:MAG: hypothetical protein FWC40_03945 [Proteobacteria bacterium]|nr:hypothetical protein [Pseudomonadota bacterium]